MSSRFPSSRADAGREIVARGGIEIDGDTIKVPSSDGRRFYRVRKIGDRVICPCADFANRQLPYKHIEARAADFARAFFAANADLNGSVSRASYHAARRQGYDHSAAGHVEVLVSGMVAETLRARREWLESARQGFAALSPDDQNEFRDAVALGNY